MKTYRVRWEIDLEADCNVTDSCLEAAKRALEIQRNPDSIATVFDVEDPDTGIWKQIDLSYENGCLDEEDK
jgi:hypothetical protein